MLLNSFFVLKFKKGKNFGTVKLNYISAYKQLSSNSSRTGEKSPGRAKDICLYQGCQLRGFFALKANFGIL
jgi:hypothetical protein